MTPAKILAVLSPVLLNADVDSQSKVELMLNTTITGLVVVFAVLILLVFVIMIFSKITLALTKKSDGDGSEKKNNAVKNEPAKKAAPSVPSAPLTASGSSAISGDIIAVIAAAVASMDASLTVKSVRRASTAQANNSGRRKAWNMAGILENTRPF